MCGDFNSVIDNELDIISGDKHNVKEVKAFNSFIAQADLYDSWRIFNPNEKEYTWSRKTPFTARRLDYIFVTDTVLNKTQESAIFSIAQSDHRAVSIIYNITDVVHGPSYWKFNDSLLRDVTFVELLNKFIEEFQIENYEVEDQLKWDLCKVKIREFCVNYCKAKKRTQKNKYLLLHNDLDAVESALAHEPSNTDLLQQRETIKSELEVFAMHVAKGAQTRARAKFIEDGEKSTKYFLNLEKVRSNAKVLDKLKREDGQIINSQNDIIKELVNFFSNRYRKTVNFIDKDVDDFLHNINLPQLSDEEKCSLEKDLSEEEIAYSLKRMKNGSSPGTDGLTTSFYKFFWYKIKNMVVNSIKAAFLRGQMSISQRKAVITLIHKGKQLSRDEIKNWRPISLTNSDYKLLAKTLAIRLSKVIHNLVNEDQVGFIKGRNVTSIIRLIDDVIDHMNAENKPGIMLALDYKAAFDTISKKYILHSFKRFNFGEKFVRWIEILMKNNNSCINYMGWISESFDINCGIRQGCPFSPMAFVLALELLAIKIRTEPLLKGIKLPKGLTNNQNIELKTLLYADDITIFVENINGLKNALSLVSYFSKFSGLAMNRDKSEAMWLGSPKNSTEKYFDLKWQRSVKILGIYFNNSIPASDIDENWSPRIQKIICNIRSWSKRNISIMGKICILKSLLLSQFIYVLQSLNAPPEILATINTLLFRFIWKKKYSNTKAFEKVKRKIICKQVEKGGLNMINVFQLQNSFLLAWAKKLKDKVDEKWMCIPTHYLSRLGENLCCFDSNIKSSLFKGFGYIKNSFWKSVLKCCLDSHHETNIKMASCRPSTQQFLWNNSNIKYKKQCLFFIDWIRVGISTLNDVIENDHVKPIERITELVGQKPSRMFEYRALRTAVESYMKKRQEENETLDSHATVEVKPSSARQFRMYLIDQEEIEPISKKFWFNKLGILIEKEHWLMAQNCTSETRLRLLHWKIMHNIYPTNILLSKLGISVSKNCTFCKDKDKIDYIEHFFYYCDKISCIWKHIQEKINYKYDRNIKINVCDALTGLQKRSKLTSLEVKYANHLILIAKMCIGIYKYNSPCDIINLFERELNIRNII